MPKIIELPNGRVDLVFEINEGEKTGVARSSSSATTRFSDYRLKDVIKTGETNWLSFLKTNDIYDPDRLEVGPRPVAPVLSQERLRRCAHRRRRPANTIRRKGFVVTFTIDEGEQYRFGAVDIQSNVPAVPGESLRAAAGGAGKLYNADAVEKSVEESPSRWPSAAIRSRPCGRAATAFPNQHVVNMIFMVEEGPHAYIERINIRGNTRTRDYVIRREFDIVEGDAYNRALVDRAERRVKISASSRT